MLPRTFYLTPKQDMELRQAAADADQIEEELIRELLAEGIEHEYASYPLLKQGPRPIVTDGDFVWAWLPKHTVKQTVRLSAEEDFEIRKIAFAQGATVGNRFYFFVIDAFRRRQDSE